MKRFFLFVIFNFIHCYLHAQTSFFNIERALHDSTLGFLDSTIALQQNYIRFQKNNFQSPNGDSLINTLYASYEDMISQKKKHLTFYHFGGSHIQADIYTNVLRNQFQLYDPEISASRGWIFPFSLAKTNSPISYKTLYTGQWTSLRCTQNKKGDHHLGVLGMSASTLDSLASITMYSKQKPFALTSLKVFYNIEETKYNIILTDSLFIKQMITDTANGFLEFQFTKPIDTIRLQFIKTESASSIPFTVYGLLAENELAGITYTSIGVNGADFLSYLQCNLFEQEMHQLPPDVCVISIGTNDANDPNFNKENYKKNYSLFIDRIKTINPDCIFILTVPNDNYKNKKPQKNIAICRDAIFEIAYTYKATVWDFYTIMGAYASSQKWYVNKLMKKDRIHFTTDGYIIKGNLFFEAFLKGYAAYLISEKTEN